MNNTEAVMLFRGNLLQCMDKPGKRSCYSKVTAVVSSVSGYATQVFKLSPK